MSVESLAALVTTSLAPMKPEERGLFVGNLAKRFCLHCGFQMDGWTCGCQRDD